MNRPQLQPPRRFVRVPAALPRLRLLPSVVFVTVLMLGVRVGDFWNTLEDLNAGQAVQAQQSEPSQTAAAVPQPAAPAADAPICPPAPAVAGVAGSAPAVDPADLPASELALQNEIAARRAALDAREQGLAQQEALLAAAQQQVDQKITEMEQLRTEINGMLAEADTERQERIASLVKIYEAMRPGDAATIFDGLEMDVLIDVLQQMREQKSAPILAAMNPDRARAVTATLAERRTAANTAAAGIAIDG